MPDKAAPRWFCCSIHDLNQGNTLPDDLVLRAEMPRARISNNPRILSIPNLSDFHEDYRLLVAVRNILTLPDED